MCTSSDSSGVVFENDILFLGSSTDNIDLGSEFI